MGRTENSRNNYPRPSLRMKETSCLGTRISDESADGNRSNGMQCISTVSILDKLAAFIWRNARRQHRIVVCNVYMACVVMLL